MIKTYAVMENGVVINTITIDDAETATIEHFSAVEIPEGSGAGIGWQHNGANFAPPAPILTIEQKLAQIEQARDFLCFSNVTALGHTWQADKRSQELLGQAIALAIAGLPLPQVWRDANNENMTVTALSDLLTVAGAMAAQTQEAYAYSWQLKAQVEAAADLAALQAVVW